MMKIIKGDSIVLMTKKQADDINIIFAKQKSKIQKLQEDLEIATYKKDSIQWLMFDQDNWIDYTILQMREDSISNASNLEMANRVRDLRAAVVSFDQTKGQYNVFPMGNYDTVTNKNGEMNLKPKRYAEKSDWYALLFTVLTVTNLMVFLN